MSDQNEKLYDENGEQIGEPTYVDMLNGNAPLRDSKEVQHKEVASSPSSINNTNIVISKSGRPQFFQASTAPDAQVTTTRHGP